MGKNQIVSIQDTGTYISQAVYNSKLFEKLKKEKVTKTIEGKEVVIRMTSTAKAVLMAIISGHFRKEGYTSLTQKTLAAKAGCRRESACKAVQVLRDLGIIYTQAIPSLGYGHLRYVLTDKFFELIQIEPTGTRASDLQQALYPDDNIPVENSSKNEDFEDYISQGCDELSQGCDENAQHSITHNEVILKKELINFQDVQNSKIPDKKPTENLKNLNKGTRASYPASLYGKNPFIKGFDPKFKTNKTPEQLQKSVNKRAGKILKTAESFYKWINSSPTRLKHKDIISRFTRKALEEYLMISNPADCVKYLTEDYPAYLKRQEKIAVAEWP